VLGALYYKHATAGGEPLPHVLDITLTSISTFVLLMSSVTMVSALAAADHNDSRRLRLWLAATLVGGVIFLLGQVYEFSTLYNEGLWFQTSLAWAAFFTLTGFHGAHVFIGALLVGAVLLRSLRTTQARRLHFPVEIVGLYWHFVDLVWIIIFTIIYLIE
ncbi:MAG TPA: heme-copper oxidase subunit III, partial [Ardenticatenaceae bacterium]|nr:heme-copper oxidase subunit III [Ardenticatenaceae bacterium]